MRNLISAFIMIFPLAFASGTPPERDILDLSVDGFKLELKLAIAGDRVRLKRTTILIDEFDFTLISNKLLGFEQDLQASILRVRAERDLLCEEEKRLIERDFTERLEVCELSRTQAFEEISRLEELLDTTKKAHTRELKTHYIIGGVGTSIVIGLIIALVKG